LAGTLSRDPVSQKGVSIPTMLIGGLATLALSIGITGCGNRESEISRAQKFDRFPLYWAGERFKRWELTHIEGLDYKSPIIGFIYGDCTPHDGEQPSCTPPLQIQVSASCSQPSSVVRRVRGAPVGMIDSAPVLYTRGAEIKVYRGEGSSPGDPIEALRALRSINRVPPVIGPEDPIPRCDR
jgi:hypothetical protein